MSIRATARLQLTPSFTLDDAAAQVDYLAGLGISHLYLSPIFKARPGSSHGYDVVDPAQVNPELGGEPALRRLAGLARQHGLGLILDIVPNHMAALCPDNAWWEDVLKRGRDSAHANTFDIDWGRPGLEGKVLLPILGRPYGEALAGGDLRLSYQAGRRTFSLRHFERSLPLSETSEKLLLAALEKEEGGLPDRLLSRYSPGDEKGLMRLHLLLERQHYRLAWWRCAADEINWRRFFEISDLVGVRVERPSVFEAMHSLVFRLYAAGLIDGLRVDHVDGLVDPAGYCQALRRRLDRLAASRPNGRDERAYLIVEKILGPAEKLRLDWEVDGSTGYDFMDEVGALLHDPLGEQPLDELWGKISPSGEDPEEMLNEARRLMISENLRSEFDALVDSLKQLADLDLATRDLSRAMLGRALAALLERFRLYRTYFRRGSGTQADRQILQSALERARSSLSRADYPALEQLIRWSNADPARLKREAARRRNRALTRFQQLTAPLAAKSLEDTVFYRYGRLLSRNEVGSEPGLFALGPDEFHERMRWRAGHFPRSMLCTATHDHKRGEDARARLAVLSEMPAQWEEAAWAWLRWPGVPAGPDAIDRYMLFQSLVGAWPPGLDPGNGPALREFIDRLAEWQRKALREAKRHTNWVAPSLEYETACREYLEHLANEAPRPGSLLREAAALVESIGPAGVINSLAQLVVRLAAPGIPDTYQGTQGWDFSLVDPDNRRPVDYGSLRRLLKDGRSWAERLAAWQDGGLKQAVLHRLLDFRREQAALFGEGEYLPLALCGEQQERALAFQRRHGKKSLLVLVSRLSLPLLGQGPGRLPLIPAACWADTALRLPESAGGALTELLTGRVYENPQNRMLPLSEILSELPVALLWQEGP